MSQYRKNIMLIFACLDQSKFNILTPIMIRLLVSMTLVPKCQFHNMLLKHGTIISFCSGDKNAYKIISAEYEWKK